MNRQIRFLGLISGLLVLALLANLTYLDLGRQTNLEADSYNVRARQAEFNVHRGQIMAGDTVIADSRPIKDGSLFTYQRTYANGPLYAPVTGFFSYIYGTSRIENSYNDRLSGTGDSLQNLLDTMAGRAPEGATVITTISPELQQAAWNALKGYNGAIIALDPATGAVKALVSTPSYDPNTLASHDFTAVQKAWDTLNADEGRPMSDRATRELFPPGSTFKLVVTATALEHGYSADSLIDTPSTVRLPGTTTDLPNLADCGNTQITLRKALQLSCNTSFANLGYALGADALRTQAEKFGFDAPHLPELGGIGGRFPATLDDAQLMMSSIGQYNVGANPLQMAMIASSFVNGGELAEPYLVQEVRAPDLSVLYSHAVTTTQAVSPDTAAAMRDLMVSVVNNGGGTGAKIPGVTVGGKSGTAQSDPANPTYGWFVSFALNPDIVVAVFLQRGTNTSDDVWGGGDAAPVAKQVLEASR